jgi:hypothetical protein
MLGVDHGHPGENMVSGGKSSSWRGVSELHLDESLFRRGFGDTLGFKGREGERHGLETCPQGKAEDEAMQGDKCSRMNQSVADIINRERYSYLGDVQIDFTSTDLAAVRRADVVFDWQSTVQSEKKTPQFVKQRWRTKQLSRASPAALEYGARESCANLLDLLSKEAASNQAGEGTSHSKSGSRASNSDTQFRSSQNYLLRNTYYEMTFLDDMDDMENMDDLEAQPGAGASRNSTPWGVPDFTREKNRRRTSYHLSGEAGAAAAASDTWGVPDTEQVDRSRRKSTPNAVQGRATSLWGRPDRGALC